MPLEVSFTQDHRGSLVNITFSLKYIVKHTQFARPSTPNCQFIIDNLAEVWFVFPEVKDNERLISFRICKHRLAKGLTVQLKISCQSMKYSEQFNCPEISTYWIDIGLVKLASSGTHSLVVSIMVSKIVTITFADIYYDTEVADFRLTTAEGSVAVHKACLAAHSEVFKAMICGQWKEAKEGEVELKGVTLTTLQHLKDYLYLGTLPDDGLRELLLLAKCYMIEHLKQECMLKLSQNITFLNLYSLLQFACEKNIPELVILIMQFTPSAVINSAHQFNKLKPGCNKVDAECGELNETKEITNKP